jgi:hypothetical protein
VTNRTPVPGELKRLEVFVGGVVGALAQVQQEARLLLVLGEERLRILGVDVRDAAAGLGQQLVPGLLDVADDALVVTPRSTYRASAGSSSVASPRVFIGAVTSW